MENFSGHPKSLTVFKIVTPQGRHLTHLGVLGLEITESQDSFAWKFRQLFR